MKKYKEMALKVNPNLQCIKDSKRKLFAVANGKGYIVTNWYKLANVAWQETANILGINN